MGADLISLVTEVPPPIKLELHVTRGGAEQCGGEMSVVGCTALIGF